MGFCERCGNIITGGAGAKCSCGGSGGNYNK